METLSRDILAIASNLPRGGGYRWTSTSGGCLADVVYRGETILRADPRGTHCCGLVFETWARAWERRGLEIPLSVDDLRRVQRGFFCIDSRRGPLVLADLGLGVDVSAAPQRGDLAQLWRRDGSGHSVIVLGWDSGRLHYISTQRSTGGIGERVEHPAELYAVRAIVPAELA